MKRTRKNLLLPLGLLVGSAAQVVRHYTAIPDLASGALLGIGIGLLLLSLLKAKPTPGF